MARTKIHGRGNTELEMLTEAELSENSHIEPLVVAVEVAGDEPGGFRPVLSRDDLWPHVVQFHVLQMGAYKHTEVERTEIGVGPILHGALLSLQANSRQEKE